MLDRFFGLKRTSILLLLCGCCLLAAQAQQGNAGSGIERAVLVRQAQIYLSPDVSSAKLAVADRGREVAILEKGAGQWLHVLATLREGGEQGDKSVTGWILDKGVIRKSTPNGDRIIFGEASGSEAEASRRGGRKGADRDAMRLYYRTWEYFPASTLAGEALYRAADIKWQLDRADVFSRPSARTGNPSDRLYGIDDELMKQVTKKFPRTRWADLAEFDMLDNKLCGDWEGQSKCPQKEAEAYEKYAQEHPESPKLQEALYQAARRRAALIEIYVTEGSKSKSDQSRQKALELTQRIMAADAKSDWALRAEALAYMVQQQIPVFGNSVE
jgi:hypothetical protein